MATVATVSPQLVVREAAFQLSNDLVMLKSGIPDHSSKFAGGGSGRTVKIAKPAKFNVVTGTWDVSSSSNDVREGTVNLTMDSTPISVPVTFTDDQEILDFTSMKDQVIRPMKDRLAAAIEREFLLRVAPGIANYGGAATLTSTAVGNLKATLSNALCPSGQRYAAITPDMVQDLVTDTKGLFNSAGRIGNQNTEGTVERWGGFNFKESTIMPTQTTGTRAASTMAATVTEGTAVFSIDIGSGTETVKKGEIFYVANALDINAQTKDAYDFPRRFVVSADATALGGIVSVTATEAVYASSTDARRNVSALPASGQTVTWVGGGSATLPVGLFFHPLFAATAFGDLPVKDEANGAKAKVPGTNIILRYEHQKNVATGITTHRFDVLMAAALAEPAFAARFIRSASTT